MLVGHPVERSLKLLHGAFEDGFALGQYEPAFEYGEFLSALPVSLELLDTCIDFGLCNFIEGTEITLFSAVFLFQFGEAGGGGFQLSLFCFNGRLLCGEVAGNNKRFW